MSKKSTFYPAIILFSICLLAFSLNSSAQVIKYVQTGEEFSGPFKSWKNVKTDFGAKGDGITNDAPAINAALQALKNSAVDSFMVLYFPAGTYIIDDSIYNPGGNYQGMAIVGEDPATTIISWKGPAMSSGGNSGVSMFNLQGWYLRVSRLTFEGNNNAYRGIFKSGAFSTHCEFSDIVFKDFSAGIGLDFTGSANGQAENAVIRCTFDKCSSGISSCNWNSLDQWVWYSLFEDCNIGINQCIGYFQIYNNVFLRSKDCDISSSPYKNVISNNISVNSKCFFQGYEALLRGNKIYSNVDSFYTGGGSSTVMLDNIIRATHDSLSPVRVGSYNMFMGNTITTINSQWKQWPIQAPYDTWDHGFGSSFNVGKQIEKAIDSNPATSFATQIQPFGVKWNCPHGTTKTVTKYTVSAPVSSGGSSPLNFELLGSNNWGYTWDTLDIETSQSFTGGGNPLAYIPTKTGAYSMYQLQALSNEWPWIFTTGGGRKIVNTGAEHGTYCEEMTLSAAPRYVYQDIKVHADSSYLISGWMQTNTVSTHTYILVLWYISSTPTAPGAIPAGYIKADTIGVATGTTAWTNYSKTITAPANAHSAQLFLEDDYLATSSGTAWFDNFSFAETLNPTLNLAFNGDFENGGVNTFEQWWQVSELTLLEASSTDITKDPNGLVTAADETWGQYYPLDNSVVDSSAIAFPDTITLPGTPQNLGRKVFEVAKGTGNDANEIQTKIDSAALLPLGNKPVVHIPFGQFSIKTTIVVPANRDMQIIGDGSGLGYGPSVTSIVWAGGATGPLVDCQGPSRVTIKDLLVNVPYGDNGVEGLLVENADQVGGRIYGQEFSSGGPQWTQPCSIGLLFDGIENSDAMMMSFYPGFGNMAMVQANGGPVLASGGNTNGQITLLGGATGDCQNLFNVNVGGRLDAEGMWNEGDWARTSGLVNLTNTFGKLTVACMSWNLLKPTLPMASTDNFSGTFTFLLNHMNQEPWSYIPMAGNGANTNVLAGYNDWGQNNKMGYPTDSIWYDSTSPAENSTFMGNTGPSFPTLNVVTNKNYNVLPDSNSVLDDMTQLRAVQTTPPFDQATGVTDVKLMRVVVWGPQNTVATDFKSSTTVGLMTINSSGNGNITVYPNPTTGITNFELRNANQQRKQVEIYNMIGEKIYSQYFNSGSKLTIDLTNEPTGVYFYRMLDDNEQLLGTGKIVITK